MSGTQPKFIEVEKDFARFVRSFRGGTIVRDLIPDTPCMELNADYWFSGDDIVAELKCLHTDVSDQEQLNRRFLSVCQRHGYSAEHACVSHFAKFRCRVTSRGPSFASLWIMFARRYERQAVKFTRQGGNSGERTLWVW